MFFHRRTRMDKVRDALKEAAAYSDTLARDGRLRSDIRSAVDHGLVATQRIRRDVGASRIPTRIARDRKLRRNVRAMVTDLEHASGRIQRRRSHRVRNAMLLIGGTGAVVAAVPATRRWISEATHNGDLASRAMPQE